ncbi:MAG: hypothetical protein ICV60_02270 [Pyrinomonadaceae bacterium]|nr:hypothetical protein [Pyrinomonadaceae bacterium]
MVMPRGRVLLLTSAIWFLIHIIIWIAVANLEATRYPFPADSVLKYWDAVHYNNIIIYGYSGNLWSFYPLYPFIVKALAAAVGLSGRPEIVGTIFSTLIFAVFCAMQARLATAADALSGIKPETIWGWLFFLFSPGSWVFHSHHTESLFLLLTFGALLASRHSRWKMAALLAGLSALTRNQGIILSIAVALEGALRQKQFQKRASVFAGSGLISLALYLCYPLYQYVKTGDPLAFLHTHSSWTVVNSFYGYIGTLWFANPWQGTSWYTILHHLFFFLMNGAAIGLLLKKEFPLAFYVFCSIWVPLYQGHLENSFRFGAVLFPALFLIGDYLKRLPRPIRYILLGAVVLLNLVYARKYALGEWAY